MVDTDREKIKTLRDATGLSFKEIAQALKDAGGDTDKAREALKARGASMAAKKSGREVREGIVDAYAHATGKVGALVEVLCETDFVARNAEFKQLAHDLAMHVAAFKPSDVTELLGQQFVKDPSRTVREVVDQHIAKLGENIQVAAFSVLEL